VYVSLETPFTVFSYSKKLGARKQEFRFPMDKAEQGCLRSHAAIEKTPDLGKLGQQFRRQIRCGITGGTLAGRNSPFLRWRLQRLDEFIRKQVLNSVR
jgi:hypothetical protein